MSQYQAWAREQLEVILCQPCYALLLFSPLPCGCLATRGIRYRNVQESLGLQHDSAPLSCRSFRAHVTPPPDDSADSSSRFSI